MAFPAASSENAKTPPVGALTAVSSWWVNGSQVTPSKVATFAPVASLSAIRLTRLAASGSSRSILAT